MIRVGIGGWTFEPWRGTFFPDKLAHARELEYASRQVTAIEVNGTYYRTQAPATFAKWAAETPDDFVFSIKALRYCTNRKLLAEAGESVAKFLGSGLTELADKLGPILWQFMPTKRFEAQDMAAFLDLLPDEVGGRRLRHALEVRHDSFLDEDFVSMARARGAAIVYARLQDAKEAVETGYTKAELDRFAGLAQAWAHGDAPADLDYVAPPPVASGPRDVFVFMINGAKVRAPAAAQALIARL